VATPYTTISLSREHLAALKKLKAHPREALDDVIGRLINEPKGVGETPQKPEVQASP